MSAADLFPGELEEYLAQSERLAREEAAAELLEVEADRVYRLERGRTLARVFGLGDAEGRLFEIVLYSPDIKQRIRAGDLLCVALRHVAQRAA